MNLLESDPRKDQQFRILDKNGKIIDEDNLPDFTDDELRYLYKTMRFERIIDEKALSYQRQGRMLTYAPNTGQEAAQIGSAYAIGKDDWLVSSFRELGAWLIKEIPLKNIYLYWYGNEWGSHTSEDIKALPVSVPIASQLQHAAGIGMANNIKGENNVVLAFVGDGGTSAGDFHEALNYASVFKAPVIFVIQNNQYAISVPRKKQTNSKTLAQKALAYDIPGILVDGNDIFAMYAATKAGVERAKNGEGPTLIEAYTYRLGAHTTSDDPTKYRKDEAVEEWKDKDPLIRFEKYLLDKEVISEEYIEKLIEDLEKDVISTFEAIEDNSDTEIEDIFKYHYEEMPEYLEEQLNEYKSFLEGGK